MLEERLGYKFTDREILEKALTHSSHANEKGGDHNERLEFLGDAVLGFIVARVLYDCYPDEPEGTLSKMRAAIVSSANFAQIAGELCIQDSIKLGIGEERTGGRTRPSILAGAFEALIGALYLDGGYDETRRVVEGLVIGCLAQKELFADYKTTLQEVVQKRFKHVPKYVVMREEGQPHSRVFVINVWVDGTVLGTGKGSSKKEAEQAAARMGLEHISMLYDPGAP